MAMTKAAVAFEKIIQADRARKKNEALAAKIFKKDTASSLGKASTRAGVKKQRVVSTSAGNVHAEWAHDLHEPRAGTKKNTKSTAAAARGAPGALASRISRPGAGAAAPVATTTATARGRQQQQRRAAKAAAALTHAELAAARRPAPVAVASGLSIRGLAASPDEPLTVMAQNFAPGTTAADIESAMTPVGGLITSCRILKTSPLVIAEIVFENGEGGRRVIETFNNQTADGRLLHVYAKVIGVNTMVSSRGGGGGDGYGSGKRTTTSVLTPHSGNGTKTPTGPRTLTTTTTAAGGGAADAGHKAHSDNSAYVVDGSMGFDDPMDTDGLHGSGRLYSDDLVRAPRAPRAAPTGPASGAARTSTPTGPGGYGGGGGGGRRGGWGGGGRGGGRGGRGGYGARR